ncbi:hypothetical protein [Rhodoblastus sp.]|uniref:hypothetical protein n=1 Tax=Rhodoblastus sp. TaxID=1962975 RepID=UPI002610251F|nr:hypothetical protein [Rhodoblastus sp.]
MDFQAARGHQPVKTFAARVGAGDARPHCRAIVETGSKRRRPLDIGAVEAAGEGAIIEALVDQAFGDEDFVGADALVAGAPRRIGQRPRRDAFLREKGDLGRSVRAGDRFKTPGAAI